MPRGAQLSQMAVRLLAAARAQDWATLEAIDRELSRQLPALAALGTWSAAERTALQALGQAHGAALRACAEASHALGGQLEQLHRGRDGWLAYALHSHHESEARP